MFLTIMLGGGLICFGVLILIFLVKFIFKVNKIDRSHLTQVTKTEQPELFKMIDEIVGEVGTDFPKKVYFSSEVNASVFYDSSFWSMFLPVRKNLHIGLGLMNTISIDELKAILAHEFGHFSQKSMRTGSYVYNVNQVIYNTLYENEGYGNFAQKLAGISNYFAFFVVLAGKIINGIQFILKKIYDVVNLNHLALSREMEFHADTVAASVAGSDALITALHRLQLADYSLNNVFNYYNGKIKDKEKTNNIFPQQKFVMDFYTGLQKIRVENHLPIVSEEHYNKFNKSKLILKDQWSSHPRTADRVEHLRKLDYPLKSYGAGIAIDLLVNKDIVLEQITKKLFDAIDYGDSPIISDLGKFEEDFLENQQQNTFHQLYNGYFDFRNPLNELDSDAFEKPELPIQLHANDFFSDENLSFIYLQDGINDDLNTLKQIEYKVFEAKTFDYDGKRYTQQDCSELIKRLESESKDLEDHLKKLDIQIFEYFLYLALKQGRKEEFENFYSRYKAIHTLLESQNNCHNKIAQVTSFMHTRTAVETIEQQMYLVKDEEKIFKEELLKLLTNPLYGEHITANDKEQIERFIASDYKYFAGGSYFNFQVDELFESIHLFAKIINDTNFNAKKKLLDFQVTLEEVHSAGNKKPVAI
ncbi:MAG: M48 family metalloprotease [Sphingobacteriaceae bacterium]|nr:M48 family metalloprotease [Sphingobacteriaceae bacterium]